MKRSGNYYAVIESVDPGSPATACNAVGHYLCEINGKKADSLLGGGGISAVQACLNTGATSIQVVIEYRSHGIIRHAAATLGAW